MPPTVTQRLHLEDTLDENPQTKAMLDLFEKDTANVKKFSKAFAGTCQQILNAQVMMISANQELAYYLRLYSEQKSPLIPPTTADNELRQPEKLTSTMNEFADYIDEVSSCFQVFATQLNDTMIYPLNKIIETDFDEIETLAALYRERGDEQEQAIQKYLRLPNRRDHDQQRAQANEEVYMAKKKFHETSMNYFTSLNMLQFKKEYMFVEPMMSMMQSLKMFFKLGGEMVGESELEGFLNRNVKEVCGVKEGMMVEVNKNNGMIELLQQDDSIYQAEQVGSGEHAAKNELLQKCGFLNLRSKFPLIFKWDRAYYFIQNGCLMHQPKNEIAGSVFLELKTDVTVALCEVDDLKFTFQINSQFPKKTFYFQANNERERAEWVAILENAISDDNKSKLENYMNNNALISSSMLRSASASNVVAEPKFELDDSFLNLKAHKISKPQQGDVFKTRFYGSLNVKADKGNEYIHDTIRQVMASRAKHNNFKMTEYNLIINLESLSLFSVPESDREPKSEQNRDLLKARFDLADLAYWSSHKENPRLFGFVIKDRQPSSVRFVCLVFESDVNSSVICEAITNSAKLAYQLLVDEKKEDHFKKMKQYEKDILLQNINGLPDKQQTSIDNSDQETDAALLSVAVNSPNPNFIVLDKEMLEYTLDLDTETIKKRSETSVEQANCSSSGETCSDAVGSNDSPSKISNESDA